MVRGKLPNITGGKIVVDDIVAQQHYYGAFYILQGENINYKQQGGHGASVAFDASCSNSIYGNSNTVQPKSLRLYPYIHI